MRVEINPPDLDSEYLRCLNACFPGWGDRQMAQWAFRRGLAPDPMPDLMVLREENELLAGSAVSYRSVVLPNGSRVRAGIMTGSWTLPAARGRGCFARIIEESVAITRERGGALLLAFVTEDNPSCRQLLKAGAAPVPTSYLFTDIEASRPEEEAAPGLVLFKDAELSEAVALWTKGHEGKCRFDYSSLEDWKGQFIERPGSVETVRNASGAFAVIDRNPTTDRILAWWAPSQTSALQLLKELRAAARSEGRKLFTFSTDAAIAAQCEAMGFKRKPGYLTVLVTDWERLGQALQTTVLREPDHHALLNPASPWFAGEWDVQSGDRM
jgi:Acetyltransferase (GNAT) domain